MLKFAYDIGYRDGPFYTNFCPHPFSVTRWRNYFPIFGHLLQWKYAQWPNKIPKVCSNIGQMLYKPGKFNKHLKHLAKVAKFYQVWSHCGPFKKAINFYFDKPMNVVVVISWKQQKLSRGLFLAPNCFVKFCNKVTVTSFEATRLKQQFSRGQLIRQRAANWFDKRTTPGGEMVLVEFRI